MFLCVSYLLVTKTHTKPSYFQVFLDFVHEELHKTCRSSSRSVQEGCRSILWLLQQHKQFPGAFCASRSVLYCQGQELQCPGTLQERPICPLERSVAPEAAVAASGSVKGASLAPTATRFCTSRGVLCCQRQELQRRGALQERPVLPGASVVPDAAAAAS